MTLIESEPSQFFVFEYPKIEDEGNGGLILNFDEPFESEFRDPYYIFDVVTYMQISNEVGFNFKTEYDIKQSCYFNKLSLFSLPFKFNSEPRYEGKEINMYIHTLIKMNTSDVNAAFSIRAFEYFKLNQLAPFLEFHYEEYDYSPNKWLDYVEEIFNEIDKYLKVSQGKISKIKKLVNKWINEKRKELAELNDEIVEQLPTEVEGRSKGKVEKRPHKEQIILLHKLGFLDLPIIQKLTGEQKGVLFGRLLGFSTDNTGDYISHIGHKGTDLNPYHVKKENYEQNILEFLKSLGIDNQ